MQRLAKRGEVLLHVVERPEVDQREPARRAPLDLVDRLLPGLEVDLRRRAGRQDEAPGRDPYARGITGVERAVGVEVGDVMPGVAGSREAFEPEDPVSDDVDVSLRHRSELAPKRVEARPVQPPGARLELRRVDQMRSPDLGDVHL